MQYLHIPGHMSLIPASIQRVEVVPVVPLFLEVFFFQPVQIFLSTLFSKTNKITVFKISKYVRLRIKRQSTDIRTPLRNI